MKNIYIALVSLLLVTACENDLDQFPPNIASSGSLTDYAGVLNAAYYYQHGSVTPMAVMGDFRADNALMLEAPYTDFDEFNANLTSMEDQFFGPFYTAMYKSILSANNVIENSEDATEVAEAKFLRGLSYFKLVRVFGDVPVNLSATPDASDDSILERQAAADVYANVIIPDLEDAIAGLDAEIVNGRASKYAAQGILGKALVQMGDFGKAESHLAAVVNGAEAAGISLQANFEDIFGVDNDLNSEIIAAHQIIINCTPLGTHPKIELYPPIPYQSISKNHFLYDLIYNPSQTKFLNFGLKANATAVNGLKMLELQAERSWEIWGS